MAIQGYWNAGAIETAPDTSTLTSKGYPTSGDPKTGTPATKPGAAWYYLQDQMRNTVINAAGLQLSEPPSPTQFLEALQSLGWMKDAALTGKMIKDGEVTFAKLAAAAIATADQALAGTANNLLMTPQTAKLLVESLNLRVPAGTLIPYIGTTVPTGYLLANGAEVSRTKYADLFAAIGTKFGVGDGATTFGLPNMNGRFIEGTTSMREVGKYVEAGLLRTSREALIPLRGIRGRLVGERFIQQERMNLALMEVNSGVAELSSTQAVRIRCTGLRIPSNRLQCQHSCLSKLDKDERRHR